MNIILIIIGAALLINGIAVAIFANFNIGCLLTVALGLFFSALGIWSDGIRRLTRRGAPRAIKYIIFVTVAAELVLVGFIFAYGNADTADYTEDAVIVLGAGVRGDRVTYILQKRLDAALDYHSKNPAALIAVTGGQGPQETVTEGSAMRKYLLANGVPDDKIITEERATSTSENMEYTKPLLDEKLGNNYRVAVVTNAFHIYRGTSIARKEGFNAATHLHGGIEWYNIVPCYLRESLAALKMWVFD